MLPVATPVLLQLNERSIMDHDVRRARELHNRIVAGHLVVVAIGGAFRNPIDRVPVSVYWVPEPVMSVMTGFPGILRHTIGRI